MELSACCFQHCLLACAPPNCHLLGLSNLICRMECSHSPAFQDCGGLRRIRSTARDEVAASPRPSDLSDLQWFFPGIQHPRPSSSGGIDINQSQPQLQALGLQPHSASVTIGPYLWEVTGHYWRHNCHIRILHDTSLVVAAEAGNVHSDHKTDIVSKIQRE